MVTRIVVGQPDGVTLESGYAGNADPGQTMSPLKSDPGTYTTNAATGEVAKRGVTKYNTGSEVNPNSADVMLTASRGGSPVRGNLQPTDLVTIQGQQMQVAIAERVGLIQKVAGTEGRYETTRPFDADGSSSDSEDSDSEDYEDEDGEEPQYGDEGLADTRAEQTLATLAAGSTAGTQVSVVQDLVNTGEVTQGTLNRAASELGMEPEALQSTLSPVYLAFYDQASDTLKALGAEDPEDCWDWARAEEPEQLRAAAVRQAMERTTEGYAKLYKGYVQSISDRQPELVLNADFGTSGITARRSEDGTVVLIIPGLGEVSYTTAVRTGLVTVRGA